MLLLEAEGSSSLSSIWLSSPLPREDSLEVAGVLDFEFLINFITSGSVVWVQSFKLHQNDNTVVVLYLISRPKSPYTLKGASDQDRQLPKTYVKRLLFCT